MVHQIKVMGELDQSWARWLGSVNITSQQQEDGSVITTLTVDTADQAALFGILDHIRDLNIPLVSVSQNEEL